MDKVFWAVEVRGPKQKNGYIMGDKVFDRKREAVKYKKDQGPCAWSHNWHIIKLVKEPRHDR